MSAFLAQDDRKRAICIFCSNEILKTEAHFASLTPSHPPCKYRISTEMAIELESTPVYCQGCILLSPKLM